MNYRGKDTYLLTSTNLKNWAKEYYGCESLLGVQLENDFGTLEAYWELTVVGNELLTA